MKTTFKNSGANIRYFYLKILLYELKVVLLHHIHRDINLWHVYLLVSKAQELLT